VCQDWFDWGWFAPLHPRIPDLRLYCTIFSECNLLLTGHIHLKLRFLLPFSSRLFNIVIPQHMTGRFLLSSLRESTVDVYLSIRFRCLVSSHI